MNRGEETPKVGFSLTRRDITILKRSDQEQEKFRAFAYNSKLFSAEEASALNIDSVAEFEKFWNLTIDSKKRLEVSRKHGVRKLVQDTQQTFSNAYDILHHLEPILQLVKEVGAPYGAMAIGTMSFLFTVAKNRDRIEDGISDVLLQIRDRVAGLKVYRHIYNDNHELDQQLQSRIIEAYDSFMGFCMEAAKYYSTGGTRRWLKALWGTSTTLDDRAAAAQKAIVDIRHKGEELLNKNVDYIKQQNTDLKSQVTKLQDELQGLRQAKDNDRLHEIQGFLKLEGYSQRSDVEFLQKYQDDLKANFDQGTWTGLELMRGQCLEEFKRCEEMRRWLQSPESCMLILAGYNNVSVLSFGSCWLSPVALDMIAMLNQSKKADPYAFYIPGLQEIDLLPQVLSHIMIQLLTTNRRALRNDAIYNELKAKIQRYSLERNDIEHTIISEKASKQLQKVLLEVLNMFGREQTVWIVVDRPDQCKRRPGPNHQKKLVKALVNLVESANVKIRILLVVNGHDWRVNEQIDEFGQQKENSVVVHTVRQRTVDN